MLPVALGVNLEVRYAGHTDAGREGIVNVLDINKAIDAVLGAVYESAKGGASVGSEERKSRKIILSSFDNSVSSQLVMPETQQLFR